MSLFYDSFTDADGTVLSAHGTAWSNLNPGQAQGTIYSNRVRLQGDGAHINVNLTTGAFDVRKGFTLYADVQWPNTPTTHAFLLLFELWSGGSVYAAPLYLSYQADIGGGPGWNITVAGGTGTYWIPEATLPVATGFRIGLTDTVGGNVTCWYQPYGGGAQVTLGTTPASGDDPATFPSALNICMVLDYLTSGVAGGYLDNLTLNSLGATPASLIVTPALAIVGQGGEAQFTGTAYDASGNVLSDTLTWASTPASLATISQVGLATAATGSFQSGLATISASDGTYATGTALLAVVLANAGLFERGAWMGTNSAPGSGRYIREVVYGIGTTGWETPTPSWGTNQWPWPSSITTQPNGAGPQIGFEVISGSTSTSSAPTGIAVQEYNNGILLSSTTAFTNPAWSSASTYALRLFWDGSSSKLTPYWNGSGSTSTGTAISLSSAFTNTWALQNWLGGVDHPSAVSADRQGYWLRSTATGNPWQPYYAL